MSSGWRLAGRLTGIIRYWSVFKIEVYESGANSMWIWQAGTLEQTATRALASNCIIFWFMSSCAVVIYVHPSPHSLISLNHHVMLNLSYATSPPHGFDSSSTNTPLLTYLPPCPSTSSLPTSVTSPAQQTKH